MRRSTVKEMEAALQGDWRDELLFVLQQSRQAYGFFQEQVATLDEKIIALLAEIPQAPPPPAGSVGIYFKLGRNRLSDLAIIGVTVLGAIPTIAEKGSEKPSARRWFFPAASRQ